MKLEELHGKYQDLRKELDDAYAAPVWDSGRIDRITEQMLPVEVALAQRQRSLSLEPGAGHG